MLAVMVMILKIHKTDLRPRHVFYKSKASFTSRIHLMEQVDLVYMANCYPNEYTDISLGIT